jgi:lysophospholipase L1-like esterase
VAPALLALLLGACADSGSGLSALPADAVILAFGNSLTRGYGAGPQQSYPAILAERSGLAVINAGVPGEATEPGLRRLPALLEAEQPDLVILCHGANDILRKLDRRRAEQNIRAMIALIREHGADVVLIGVPAFGPWLTTADLYLRIAEDLRVPLEAEILPKLLGDAQYKSDAVHPNAAGYARLAEAVHALLREEGAL